MKEPSELGSTSECCRCLNPHAPAKQCTTLEDKARDTTSYRDEYLILTGRFRLPVHILFCGSVLSVTERSSKCVVKADVQERAMKVVLWKKILIACFVNLRSSAEKKNHERHARHVNVLKCI